MSWFDYSLEGDLDETARVQYREAREASMDATAKVKEDLTDYLSDKRVPAPPCPGFERLDAIMSIEMNEPENNLATYKPTWSSGWAEAMSTINSEELS